MKTNQKLKTILLVPIFLFSAFSGTIISAQELDLENTEVRTGYSIGVNIGLNLATQGIISDDIDNAALLRGFQDAINDQIMLGDEEIIAALEQYSMMMEQRAQDELEAMAQASIDFLDKNAMQPGVVTTASGLQYLVLEEGSDTNAPMPLATDEVEVHYHGTMIDGRVFDSSVDRGEPISFPLDGVIAGWTEGLQLMKVGDKYRFFIPAELAYGAAGAGGTIPPYAALIFDVELLGIN